MALLNLAEAKAQLNITGDTDDLELQAYIDALPAVIERIVGPVENRTVTEMIDGYGTRLALSQVPAVSLTSLTPVLTGGLAIDAGDVVLDGESGILRRRDGAAFRGGPWTAVYVAGRGEVSPTINLASRMLLQHLWRTQLAQARGGLAGGGGDFEPIPGLAYAVPNRVLELLEAYKQPAGVA